MERTRQALDGLVHYEETALLRPLEMPFIEKDDIPRFIVCPAYERARARIDRSMERYTAKVAQAEERLQQSKEGLDELEATIEYWAGRAKGVSTFSKITLDRSSASSVDRYNRDVARHNEAVDQTRRYQDRLEDAIDKHNDLVERYTDTVREAEDKLEELTVKALKEIDEDLVSFLERYTSVIDGLREAGTPENVAAALEASYLALRLHSAIEGHIENANSRREVRERVESIESVMFDLCASKELRGYLMELFRDNVRLAEQNRASHARVCSLIEEAGPCELAAAANGFQRLFDARFTTSFSYRGIVDPSELESVIRRMQGTVNAIKDSAAESRARYEETASLADAAVSAHQESMSILAEMRASKESSRESTLTPDHFACDLVDTAVIDGFFKGETRKAAFALREHLCEALEEERLQALIEKDNDRYFTETTERVISEANLTHLQAVRGKVDGHVRRMSAMIPGIAEQIHEAEKVPEQNTEGFRSLASYLYPLSCFPVLGFLAAWFLLYKVESFGSAFSSTNRVYQGLKSELLERNPTFKKINTWVFINIAAALIIAQVDKRLRAYPEQYASVLEADRTSVGD